MQAEPPGPTYWNGKPNYWAKGPGESRPLSAQGGRHGRKNVIRKYPFADHSASVPRVIRRGLPVPQHGPPAPTYRVMNSLGVPPLCTLDKRVRSGVISKTFREFHFCSRGLKKEDVKEALMYCGCIGDDVGVRVDHALRQVNTGGMSYFTFEHWLDIVERFTELDLLDREEEHDEFFEEAAGSIEEEQPPELPIEGVGEDDKAHEGGVAEEAPRWTRRQVTKGGNVIPWDGTGTRRSAQMPDNPENYKHQLRSDEGQSILPRSSKGPKSAQKRWKLDRDFARRRAEKVKILRDAHKQQQEQQPYIYGRANMGGMTAPKTRQMALSEKQTAARKNLRVAIQKGRQKKESANLNKSSELREEKGGGRS